MRGGASRRGALSCLDRASRASLRIWHPLDAHSQGVGTTAMPPTPSALTPRRTGRGRLGFGGRRQLSSMSASAAMQPLSAIRPWRRADGRQHPVLRGGGRRHGGLAEGGGVAESGAGRGQTAGRLRSICDTLASEGFVVLPDCHRGDSADKPDGGMIRSISQPVTGSSRMSVVRPTGCVSAGAQRRRRRFLLGRWAFARFGRVCRWHVAWGAPSFRTSPTVASAPARLASAFRCQSCCSLRATTLRMCRRMVRSRMPWHRLAGARADSPR